MRYMTSTFPFAGLYLDGILDTETNECFLSLSSTGSMIEKSAEVTSRFFRSNQPEALPYNGLTLHKIRVGRASYTLVPTTAAAAFIAYWARKGNKTAIALLGATFQSDLDRSIRESNGVTVTAAQHETNRQLNYEAISARLDAYHRLPIVQAKAAALSEELCGNPDLSYEEYQLLMSDAVAEVAAVEADSKQWLPASEYEAYEVSVALSRYAPNEPGREYWLQRKATLEAQGVKVSE